VTLVTRHYEIPQSIVLFVTGSVIDTGWQADVSLRLAPTQTEKPSFTSLVALFVEDGDPPSKIYDTASCSVG
jgi:hypothetical protein